MKWLLKVELQSVGSDWKASVCPWVFAYSEIRREHPPWHLLWSKLFLPSSSLSSHTCLEDRSIMPSLQRRKTEALWYKGLSSQAGFFRAGLSLEKIRSFFKTAESLGRPSSCRGFFAFDAIYQGIEGSSKVLTDLGTQAISILVAPTYSYNLPNSAQVQHPVRINFALAEELWKDSPLQTGCIPAHEILAFKDL